MLLVVTALLVVIGMALRAALIVRITRVLLAGNIVSMPSGHDLPTRDKPTKGDH